MSVDVTQHTQKGRWHAVSLSEAGRRGLNDLAGTSGSKGMEEEEQQRSPTGCSREQDVLRNKNASLKPSQSRYLLPTR